MRAGLVLQALAGRFDVHLLVVPVAGEGGEPSEFVRQYTVRAGSLELSGYLDPHFGLIARISNPKNGFEPGSPTPSHCSAGSALAKAPAG